MSNSIKKYKELRADPEWDWTTTIQHISTLKDSLCFHTSSAPPSYIHLPLLTSSSSIRFLTDSVQLLLTSFVLLYQRSQSRTCVRRILSGHKTKRLLSDVNRLPQLHFKDFSPYLQRLRDYIFFFFFFLYSEFATALHTIFVITGQTALGLPL